MYRLYYINPVSIAAQLFLSFAGKVKYF